MTSNIDNVNVINISSLITHHCSVQLSQFSCVISPTLLSPQESAYQPRLSLTPRLLRLIGDISRYSSCIRLHLTNLLKSEISKKNQRNTENDLARPPLIIIIIIIIIT